MTADLSLMGVIRREIELRGSIPFARFMELALYHPTHGYYCAEGGQIGREGDFITSVAVGPVFGGFLAMQFAEMWERMGRPKPFTLLELGSHRGWLAEDVLAWARQRRPDFADAVEYWICDSNAASVSPVSTQRKSFTTWYDIPNWSVVGCIFSNELVDALPVHRIRRTSPSEWKEFYVTFGERGWVWELGPPSFSIDCLPLTLREFPYPPGYMTEVHLAALDWVREMARILKRGFLLTIDYGYTEAEYYAPHRPNGTLRCYHRHEVNTEPLERVGEQDITAHVNFGALITQGIPLGLDFTGLIDQSRFLMGIGQDEIERIVNARPGQPDKARRQLQMLLNPADMGRAFKVLIQHKGVDAPRLSGLRYARG